jgi:hypothetical protein
MLRINQEIQTTAHIKKVENQVIVEALEEHSNKTLEYYKKIAKQKNLDKQLTIIAQHLGIENKQLFKQYLEDAIKSHDLGKINPEYQIHLEDTNPEYQADKKYKIPYKSLGFSHQHSILSAIIYLYNTFYELEQQEISDDEKDKLQIIIMLNSYVISRHHSDLNNYTVLNDKIDGGLEVYFALCEDENGTPALLETFIRDLLELNILKVEDINEFDEQLEEIKDTMDYLYDIEYNKTHREEIFIYTRLLYSLMVASDYYATTDFMQGFEMEIQSTQEELLRIKENYNNLPIIKEIRETSKQESSTAIREIDKIRTQIFKEAEENYKANSENRLFFLESPTGSGKTNTSLNIAYQMINGDLEKIYLVYPFNTLIEQNRANLLNYVEEENLAVINSLEPLINENQDNEEISNDKATEIVYNRQFLTKPLQLTTSVNLFNILFSSKRKSILPLYNLINSVIIIDEIQAYKETIWNETIEMLKKYSELLNLKFLIMSATLPDFSRLLDEQNKEKIIKLIQTPEKYYQEKLFKDRVELNFDLLEKSDFSTQDLIAEIKNKGKNYNKILIEFIIKSTTEKFYQEVLESGAFESYQIEILTGDDNVKRKKEVIEKVKNTEKVILIATQVVEAGVDIDMDLGYKNISKLENEEQFLGRINRSSTKKDSKVYFFKIDAPSKIYLNILKTFTVEDDERKQDLINKTFTNYFNIKLQKAKESQKGLSYENYKKNLKNKNFKIISDHMKQIKDDDYNKYTIYLIEPQNENGENTEEYKLWEELKAVKQDYIKTYAQKEIDKSRIINQMSENTYSVSNSQFEKIEKDILDEQSGIYLVKNARQYKKNGRLNIAKN